MNIAHAMEIIGPIVLIVNLMTMFYYVRPKRGMPFTLCVYVVVAVAGHIFMILTGTLDSEFERFMGLPFLPATLWLFSGMTFQKVFAFFMQYQITALPTHLADALVGASIGYDSPHALIMFLTVSLVLLAIYMALVLRYGRQLFERMFLDGRRGQWVLYSFGAIFSFMFVLSVNWATMGAVLYFALMLFILWSFGVLCFMIISAHEKAAQVHNTETMALQMNAMREQTESEKKHRADMEILRHDMRHEMGAITELYRTGKADEAEAMYADWQTTLHDAVPALLCAEPVLNAVLTRLGRKAKDRNIALYVNSNIPGELPLDTIKLSVMVANALENALAATDKVTEAEQRLIRVKLIQSGNQIGLEVVNPCTLPVEFNEAGLPVTNEIGHGIGVRSIAAFARDNDYILDFSNTDSKFTMRLVMRLDDAEVHRNEL